MAISASGQASRLAKLAIDKPTASHRSPIERAGPYPPSKEVKPSKSQLKIKTARRPNPTTATPFNQRGLSGQERLLAI
jgi:hypothetical protein